MEGLNVGATGGLGGAGRVAIIEIDPFKEGFAYRRRDGRAGSGRHNQPLVPTARRYSVTWTVPDTPASIVSALRIAG
jgi:hypothetical protein